jgi:hypothetical protein
MENIKNLILHLSKMMHGPTYIKILEISFKKNLNDLNTPRKTTTLELVL